jgi:hypothetical protein
MRAQWFWQMALRDLVGLVPPKPRTRLTAGWTDLQLLMLGLVCGMALASVWMVGGTPGLSPVGEIAILH